jgi:hypothetical protein
MHMRLGSADHCVWHMRGAAGAAYAGARRKVRAAPANVGGELRPTSSTMRDMGS